MQKCRHCLTSGIWLAKKISSSNMWWRAVREAGLTADGDSNGEESSCPIYIMSPSMNELECREDLPFKPCERNIYSFYVLMIKWYIIQRAKPISSINGCITITERNIKKIIIKTGKA